MNIESLFDPIINQAAWSVRHTHGSCIFIEFGNPHWTVREPVPIRENMSKTSVSHLRRRKIGFCGDWSLLVYTSDWLLNTWELSANNDSTPSEMTLPLESLDGQYLKSVSYDGSSKTTTLLFDLGAELRMWPNNYMEEFDTQWSLCSYDDNIYRDFISNGEVLIKRGDGSAIN